MPFNIGGSRLDSAANKFEVDRNVRELLPVLPIESKTQDPGLAECMLNSEFHFLGKDEIHLKTLGGYVMRQAGDNLVTL